MPTATKVHVFVEVTKNDHRKIEFDTDTVTGQQIKERAGVPLDSDLGLRRQGSLGLVTNDQQIVIKNGDHFISLPPGSIS